MKKKYLKNKKKKAVAMRYKQGEDRVPKIVAKGQDKIAERIVQLADEHEIPLFEDASLTEALSYVGLGEEVPENLYELVAQVLAFVYRLEENWREKYL